MCASCKRWQALGQGEAPPWLRDYPKIGRQHALKAAGLRVPSGYFGQGDIAFEDLPLSAGQAQWILRSVFPGEDTLDSSSTGLALSVLHLSDPQEMAKAQLRCRAHLKDLADKGLVAATAPQDLAWLIQSQIRTEQLAVAIYDHPNQRWYLEFFAAGEDPLSGEHPPTLRGFLQDLRGSGLAYQELASREIALQDLHHQLAQCLKALPSSSGLEVELVQDQAGQWHCVQAKPNATELFAQYQPFLRAAQAAFQDSGTSLADYPLLELDAEHNPESLSPAHQWLMEALGGNSPSYLVVGGWLYCIKEDTPSPDRPPMPPEALPQCLQRLQTQLLPQAQTMLSRFERAWSQLPAMHVGAALDQALALCRALLKMRSMELDPVAKHRPPAQLRQDFAFAATLAGADAFSAHLPTRWDLAAPSLDGARLPPSQNPVTSAPHIPGDRATQWDLLQEWDDHLFALALAAPRWVWLRLAASEEIPEELLFCVGAKELRAYGQGALSKAQLLDRCREGQALQERQRQLVAPLRLLGGKVAPPVSAQMGRGIPFGPPRTAELYKRQDLESLLTNPPPPESILAIPTLTAPAALALHRLGIVAVVTEHGGLASHGARMAAELGLSALIGARGCMQIPNGQRVLLDTRCGRLRQAQS